jgi:NhaP-type Na+/H+ or K+/H+ antiporter
MNEGIAVVIGIVVGFLLAWGVAWLLPTDDDRDEKW